MEGNSLIFSLRNVLDSMVFGMSHVPGFSALSIPIFISNYLFDLFSEFFAVLVLFALAVMSFDAIRRGRQSLKEDLINLSLVIITIFVILNFKDKSVTYQNTPSYGIVTVYAGLLKKGEDIADALTYAMLYNTPTNGKYSPNKQIPNANTPLSGIVGNSFFSFVINNGNINKKALENYINQRAKIIENYQSMIKDLFNQDSFNIVLKNTFNYARGAYVSINANKSEQGYMYMPIGAAATYNETNQMIALYDRLLSRGYPLDKSTQIIYSIPDGQTPDNQCMFFKFVVSNKNGKTYVVDFKNIEKYINNLLNFNYFNYVTKDCEIIPNKIGGSKGLTYPYILKNELKALSYFWGKVYSNLKTFKDSKNGKILIGKDNWKKSLSIIKKIAEFYSQSAKLVQNNFPLSSFKSGEYSLIINPDKDIDFGLIHDLRSSLYQILQEKANIIKKYKKKKKYVVSPDEEQSFFASMNVLLKKHIVAIDKAYVSARLFNPDEFLKGHWGTDNNVIFPESFKKAFTTTSIITVPYQAIALTIATKDKGANVINFYNDLSVALSKVYQRINANNIGGSFGMADYKNIKNEMVEKIRNGNIFKKNKGPSLNELVLKEYGYDPRVDFIFPDKKMSLNLNRNQVEKFLQSNAYKNKNISWVDLGYYFSILKSYTSNFIIFNTFALANNAFSISANIDGKALSEAIKLAQEYTLAYNKNFSDDAKTKIISESVANTMAFISTVKSLKDGLSINSLGWIAAGFSQGAVWGLIITLGSLILKTIILGIKVGATFLFYLIAVTIVLKLITILVPAMFWMIAVINWFFKSAMMIVMLPINVFLMFFKSRRQVFFQALWKLLAQMLTPVALVATFFIVIVFSVEIDFLLSYFVPFLNDNVIVYFFSDEGMRHIINSIAENQYKEAQQLSDNGNWFLASIQYIKAWFAVNTAKVATWIASKTGLTAIAVKIIGIILLMIKTVIVFVINLTLYMLFFRADDYVREVLGEVFGASTAFDSSMERIMGKFGANRLT